MSEKPLLLSPAKSGVLVNDKTFSLWRGVAIAVGFAVILVGAADAASRLAHATLGDRASLLTFAPAVLINDPSLFSSASGTASSSPITPAWLKISSIGVNAAVEAVGNKSDGSMATPSKFNEVAWYQPGGKPGGPGNAVFAGHVNNALTTAGVFEHLSQLKLGDSITVSDAAGKTRIFVVKEITDYPANTAPAASIFATSGSSQVVFITCDGQWDSLAHSFDKRLVVIARLI